MIVNRSETDEKVYLQEVVARLKYALEAIDGRISSARQEILEAKKYLWANSAQIDPAERAANKVEISLSIGHGEQAVVKRGRLRKLLQTPYFGRVDFQSDHHSEALTCYIGVHSFAEEDSQENVIYDWRSPIASMFYDFNTGRANYSSPSGEVAGEITLKRQYSIKNSKMEYMIESSLNINDDVLQKELSRTSDEKMKNIVATIQKEQNVIIRNESARELIIQGVAGSGKTSVALHRVAYLLYRYKETLTSQNILILSPNKVFSDYISNVLPELGEEKIMELSFDELAAAELAGICGFQTFYQQVAELAGSVDDSAIERIRYKADMDFVQGLESYILHISEAYFVPADISVGQVRIPAEEVLSAYQSARSLPVRQRLEKTASILSGRTRDENGRSLPSATANTIKTAVKKMFKSLNMLTLYKDFYEHTGRPELFKLKKAKLLEFCDVFPLVYLKLRMEGTKGFDAVKHLLVDEMQDYTAIQYRVLALLFQCKKTILGDSSQSVNPYSSSSISEIKQVFPGAGTVELLKSYRSTLEIIHFAQGINHNTRIVPVERHGEPPVIIGADTPEEELSHINRLIARFRESGHHSLGVVCKTHEQAQSLYEAVKSAHKDMVLLDFSSDRFHEGIMITSAHMAKGLEFDQVIIPFCDAVNYRTELDRSMLYIACTRAMHVLALTFCGEASGWL
ncbi:HelD family protein [Paenibacillus graminis]|uniref:HelD family protein n=1 Tax=Paenibacillus graminis TaxID=189425 RepID=UPI0004AF5306|nr:UvrD-helicase domain-containing protein [Paenibacillus graminis]